MNGRVARAAIAALALALSYAPARAAELRGVVVEYVAREGQLVRAPVIGAHVLAGRGIWLETEPGGRDRLRGGRPLAHARTAEDGSFSLAVPQGDALNIVVWRGGYAPVMRRGVRPAEKPLVLVLSRLPGDAEREHRLLELSDRRLIFDPPPVEESDHFFDPARGILATVPPGFVLRAAADHFTVVRLTSGAAEIRLLDPGRRFSRETVRQFIGEPARGAEQAELVLSRETRVGDRWALLRVFRGKRSEVRLLYLEGEKSSIIIACSGPLAGMAAVRRAFETFAEDLVLVGEGKEQGERLRCPELGVELVVPRGWEVAQRGGERLVLRFARRSAELAIWREPCATRDPLQALEALPVGSGLALRRARWVLVGGEPAPERTYRSTGAPRRALRRVALVRGGFVYFFELRAPALGFSSACVGVDCVLESVRFTD